jgi:outer membrane protein assembly factor BamB
MVWERSIFKARTEIFNRLNGPTTPSPVTDGRRVFVFFPEFGILAYDYEGQELWRMPMGPFASIQGLAASPIYVDGKVVLLIDTVEEAYLSAFDAGTGKQSWKIDRPVGMLGSYATPTVYVPIDGPTQVVVAGAVELTGYEARSGDRLWWVHGLDVFPTAPPFVVGDSVYTVEPAEQGWPAFGGVLKQFDADGDGRISFTESAEDQIWTRSFIGIDREIGNGDGMVDSEEYSRLSTDITGGGLTRTRVTGKGDVSQTHIAWRHTRSMPSMAGALLYQDVLYVVRKAVVTTFDPNTGELLRRERLRHALGEYYASPVAGDGKIYLVSLDGKTSVLRAGSEWQILATGDLGEQVIATPAIAEGRVFIRTESTFYCFGTLNP